MNEKYTPLHLKYRPQTFNHVLGQTKATNFLELAIKKNKIIFAYLFIGQHGSGKTTLARIMAKALNCTSKNKQPCNICDNCLSINSKNSFDFYEIDAAKNTGIDHIREIIDNIQFAPMMAKYKVCIIDEAHMLSKSAFNSLLKTLEAPPVNTVFILSTTSIRKIPNTIISRCQKIYFQPIKDQDLAISISKIIYEENIEITNKAIGSLLKLSKGSFRDALNIIELFVIEKERITERNLNEKYLIPPSILVELLIDKLLNFKIIGLLSLINYFRFQNWNNEDIIDLIYKSLIDRCVKNKIINSAKKTSFFSTEKVMNLLKILSYSKINRNNDFWSQIIVFVSENLDNKNVTTKVRKRRKCKLYIEKRQIYSN